VICLRTVSGACVDLEWPAAETIHLRDIARGLSHTCRFAGQLDEFYSIAQHSLLVAELVHLPYKLDGLLHDASEAYMCDLSRNLKHHPMLDGYRILEGQLQRVIRQRFKRPNLSGATELHLKAADDLAAIFEDVTLRQHAKWNAPLHIHLAIENGFVTRTPFAQMLDLARALPVSDHHEPFKALSSQAAEAAFYRMWWALDTDGNLALQWKAADDD
jgi:hypothetical protein